MSSFRRRPSALMIFIALAVSRMVPALARAETVETFNAGTSIFTTTYAFHVTGRPDEGVFDIDDLSNVAGVPVGLPSLPISSGGDKELRFHKNPVSSRSSIYVTLTGPDPVPGWSTGDQKMGGAIAFTATGGTWNGGLVLRGQDGGGYTFVNGYVAAVTTTSATTTTLAIYRMTGGVLVTLAEATTPPQAGENYRVEFEAQGTSLTARFFRVRLVAGQLEEAAVATLTAADSTYSSGSYAGLVAFMAGGESVLFDNIVLGAVKAPAPLLNAPLVSQQVAIGAPVKLVADASNTEEYQWFKDGVEISGATTDTLSIGSFQFADRGRYSVRMNGSGGVSVSAPAELHIQPQILTQPASVTAVVGSTVTLSVDALYAVSYQWLKNNNPIVGATSATLTLNNISASDEGSYQVSVIGTGGAILSLEAIVSTKRKPASRLVNLSVRSRAGNDSKTLIMGFVVAGDGGKQVLVRGIGPTLLGAGVASALNDPQLKLFDRTGTKFAENDNWGGTATLRNKFVELGAGPLENTSKDAALLTTLTSAPYTAHITTPDGSTGIALVEVYDAALDENARLVNVSARAEALTGDDTLIAGFVISGDAPKNVLIRGVGPTLTGYGVAGVLADPKITLYNNSGQKLSENDNWGGTTALKDVFSQVGAGPLVDDASKDAAFVATLNPGVYTVHVTGVNNTTGVALVEIFEAP